MIAYTIFVLSGIVLIPLFHVILFYIYSNAGEVDSIWGLYRQTQCSLNVRRSRLTRIYRWYVIIWICSFVLWFAIIILSKLKIFS